MLRMRITLVLAALVGFTVLFGAGAGAAEQTNDHVKRFNLYATDGTLVLPDGEEVYIWGYSLKNEKGTATYPAPTLEVNEGDQVEVTLTNIGPEQKGAAKAAHTIHWHGLDTDQANDGVPHTSKALMVGDSFTYAFTAEHAGTYFYHCHVDTIEHLQMGMHGAFIVNAKDGANQAWTNGPAYDKEYVMVFNEIDPVWHDAVRDGKSYDRTRFEPKYFTINGKAYPDTENDPSSMIHASVGETVLVRLINSGYQPHSIHMHGYHFDVVASDGRPLEQAYSKDTILVGPGERYDLLVTFDQSGHFPLHSHNITDNLNNGIYPGGMHTMMNIASTDDMTERTVTFKTGKSDALVNGHPTKLTAVPRLINNTTYVPLSFIKDLVGAELEWSQADKSATFRTVATEMTLWVDRKSASVNGRTVSLSTPPILVDSMTMAPLRFVTEALGAKVDFNLKTGDITLRFSVPHQPETSEGTDASHDSQGHHQHHEPTAPAEPIESEKATIQINAVSYSPLSLTVAKGTEITWVNKDRIQVHTVTANDESFDSGAIAPGASWSRTFDQAGTYDYYCTLHTGMKGSITVTE